MVEMLSILITAGPTREKIDPVRFISNYSTGQFGHEIAREAKRRGYQVTLISGPGCPEPPAGVKVVEVESAMDMGRAVKKYLKKCDCLIMAAAVSDWRAASPSKWKIKRGRKNKKLELVENPDILAGLGKMENKILAGFALETERLAENAAEKLKKKNLDLIIANKVGEKTSPFGRNRTEILMLDRFGNRNILRNRTKRELAKRILDKVAKMNKKAGFTLIELAIVVGIFLLVMAALGPFVHMAKARANRINCANNLRKISLGLHMYAADHKDAFPPNMGSLYPDYVEDPNAFDCPATKKAGTKDDPDYSYTTGLTETSSPKEIIAQDFEANHKRRGKNVVRINGSVE